jgi:hypothetical protein
MQAAKARLLIRLTTNRGGNGHRDRGNHQDVRRDLKGGRFKAATRFAIGEKSVDGLPTLSRTRFTQLVDAGLARLYGRRQ